MQSTDSFHASDGAEGAGDGIRPCIQNVSNGGRGERDSESSGADLLKHCLCARCVPRATLPTRESEISEEEERIETMGNYNAVYTLLWKRGEDGVFRVVDEYTLHSRKRF